MRNLHTSIPVGLATDNHSVETEIKLRENSHTPVSLDKSSYSPPKNRNGFSQVTRNSVMQKKCIGCIFFYGSTTTGPETTNKTTTNIYRIPGTVTKITARVY